MCDVNKWRRLMVAIVVFDYGSFTFAQQQKLVSQTMHTDAVTSVVFSPDGRTVASGSLDKRIILWDVSTAEPLGVLNGHSSYVYCLAFSPDGKLLASGSGDGTIKLWDVKLRSEARTLLANAGVEVIAFSSDGKLLASIDDFGRTMIWNPETGRMSRILPISGAVNALAFGPSNQVLVTAGERVTSWNASTGELIRTISNTISNDSCDRCRFYSVAFSANGDKLAIGAQPYSGSPMLLLLSLAAVNSKPRIFGTHDATIYALAFTPDGKTIASGSYDRTIKLWYAESGLFLRSLKDHVGYVQSLAFSPNAKLLVSGGGQYGRSNHSIILWSLDTGTILHDFRSSATGTATLNAGPALFPADARQLTYGDPRSTAGVGPGIGAVTGGGIGPGAGSGDRPAPCEGNIAPNSPGGSAPAIDYNQIFSGKNVTQKARVLSKPEPEYTEKARTNGITGTVVLRGVFASDGSVTNVRILSSLPYGLTDRALFAARHIRFQPAIKDCHYVSMWIQLEYNFNLY